MPDTREASQRNITQLFEQVITEYQGAIKIEVNYPRWEDQLDASTLTPRLVYYYLGNPSPQYLRFSRPLFDDCANENNTEELARAEDIIRTKLASLIKNRQP
jgi:hypothetical protein